MELKLGYATPEAVRELFAEYTHMLVAHDPYFQAYLDLQHYDAEVADPTQKYGLPDGRLYVAWCDGQPAGCIALRRLDGTTCELKRLYVRPAFRGRGIAGAMMQRILDDARAIGYTAMLLDTLPFLTSAIRMYRALIAPVEIATGKQAYFCGKPNPLMMRTGLRMLGCHSGEAVMIGDRMDTDVISGMESGMATVLVLSGVSTRATLDEFAYRPSVVLDGVGDIPRLAQQG